MKKILVVSVFILVSYLFQLPHVLAVHVNGYYRSNGTYVNSYERTAPDGNPYNNYSYPGNYNPNTGKITGGSAATYLDNYYNRSSGTSYSGSSYSYPTTPTCPLNSYYDGISSCKCNYGYTVSGNSCVSQDSLCHDQIGYNSSYDSLNNTCKCDYGYVIGSSGQCRSASLVCSDMIGYMSQYNSLTNKCECLSGYEFDGSSCVYKKTTYSNSSATYTNTYNCPLNSHTSPTDSNSCLCDTGYQVNSTKTACVLYATDTNTLACTNAYGANSIWDGTKTSDGKISCTCKVGARWNKTRTGCYY